MAACQRATTTSRSHRSRVEPDYDPSRPKAEREAAKVAELAGTDLAMSMHSLRRLKSAYKRDGLWGLVDKRRARLSNPLRNADPLVLEAMREQQAAEVHGSGRRPPAPPTARRRSGGP